MDKNTNQLKHKGVYTGRKSCGCCVSIIIVFENPPKEMTSVLVRFVSDMIKVGLIVNFYTWSEYTYKICKEDTFMDCTHSSDNNQKEQLSLGV